MTTFILFITLISICVPIYVYIGYPALLFILTKIKQPRSVNTANITPQVTMFVSCYNEEDVIEKKIHDCLALDYPAENIEFVFVSDGSDDNTDDIVKKYSNNPNQDKRIRLIRQEGRLGKTSGLNLAMSQTESELVVFSDANAMYEPQAIKQLVRNFNDEEVGYVVGAALYTDGSENSAASSENAYWEYEMALKKMETQLHSVVGGDGAIYAIRRKLFINLDREDINDFVNPLQIIAQGYRGIFEPEAKCYEETAGDFEKEGNRKERIVNRSFRGLMKVKEVMNPFKTGFFSLEIISHKLLRWLIPAFFFVAAIGSIYLSLANIYIFHIITLLGLTFLCLALYGQSQAQKKEEHIHAIFYYPYYFMLVNIKSLKGIIAALKGNIQVTWSTPRDKQDNVTLSTPYKTYRLAFIIFSACMIIFTLGKL